MKPFAVPRNGRAMLREFQNRFAELVRADTPAAPGIAIYRANRVEGLIAVLATAYPVVRVLAGPKSFRELAAQFIEAMPPCTPALYTYGAGFADLLERPGIAVHPCLVDVARLEWARVEASVAADAPPLAPPDLQAIPADDYPDLRLKPHSATRLVHARCPVARIWATRAAVDTVREETVIVTRPALAVRHRAISAGDAALVEALTAGNTLDDAARVAWQAEPSFDLQRALHRHLEEGTFADYERRPEG